MIESINYQLRKVTKTSGHFPTDDALVRLLHFACREMGRTGRAGQGGRSTYSRSSLDQFDVIPRTSRPGPTSTNRHALAESAGRLGRDPDCLEHSLCR